MISSFKAGIRRISLLFILLLHMMVSESVIFQHQSDMLGRVYAFYVIQ